MGSASVVAFGAGIVRQKIFAVFLGPAGFGLYGVIASFFELLGTASLMGTPTGLLRESSRRLADGDPGGARRVLRIVRRAVLAASAGVILLAWGLSPILGGWIGVPSHWVWLAALGLPAVVLTATAESVVNAFGAIRALAGSKILTSLSSLAAMAALVSVLGVLGAVLQLVAGAVIAAIVSGMVLRRIAGGARSVEGAARAPAASVVLGAVLAVGLAQTAVHAAASLNRFLFRSLVVVELGDVAAGLYQGAMGLSQQYNGAFSAALFVFAYPLLSRLADDPVRFRETLKETLRFVLSLTVPVALLLMSVRDLLVAAVFTADFGGMVPLLVWTLPVDAMVVVLGVLRIAVLAAARPRTFLFLGLGFEAVHTASFLLGLSLWGLEGAVAAYAVAAAAGLAGFGACTRHMAGGGFASDVTARFLAAVSLLTVAFFLPLGWWSRALMVAAALFWLFLARRELKRGFS